METKKLALAIAGGILIAGTVQSVVKTTAAGITAWWMKRKFEKAMREGE